MSQFQPTQLVVSEEVPLPETEDRSYRRLGWIVLGLFIGIFGIWSTFAPLKSTVPAGGKVIVASNNQVIQHLEGGIVKAILVHDGDLVAANQTLIQLDTTQAGAQLKMMEAQYYEALALESRLLAERDGLGSITFNSELASMENVVTQNMILDGQRREFNARAQQHIDEKRILGQRIEQMRNQIQGLDAITKSKNALSKSYEEEIRELEVLYKEQLIDKMRLRDAKRQKVQTDGDIANAKTDIARTKAQISEVDAQIIAQNQIFIKDVIAELRDVQTKIADMRARISALKDTLSRTRISSPVNGTVTNLAIHTVGGIVPAARPIMEILPSGEPLIIEGRVSATDINSVHVELKADIQFPSFAHIKTLHAVEGEVIHIGADTVVDEATHALYYPVKIRITPKGQTELLQSHLTLQAGIPADAMIVVASRTFADYLVHPFKLMFKKSFNEQ